MLEQVLNLNAIILNVAGLLIAMFFYVDNPKRDFEFGIVYLLCNLLSNYYWGIYTFLMWENPNVSSFIAYFGWNLAYIPLLLMLLNKRKKEGIKFFSPLCLIPIPLNIIQFCIYMQYGGLFNNLWEGLFATALICLSLNRIIYYIKNRKNGAVISYEAALIAFFIVIEYTMWTSSCFDWPSELQHPYNYACFLMAVVFVLIPFAVAGDNGGVKKRNKDSSIEHLAAFIRPFYIAVVFVCCVGGYVLAAWMKNILLGGTGNSSDIADSDPFRIIAAMLFVFSLVLGAFSMTLVMVVRFASKAAETEELRKAKAVADHSNAAKSDFLANMSHEIRTPINAVLGMNEMILRESLKSRDDPPTEKQSVREIFSNICNYAGNIESAGTNLLSIINDILDFSKIEAGKLEIVEGNYRLSSVLNDLCNVITFKARDKGLKFEADVDPDLPDGLYGDEVRLRQVITNILNNAVKYTKAGSVHLSVRGRWAKQLESASAIYLIISVKDTGIGIKEEDIDRLFTKFERMDLQTNSTVEGTGLGLAITKSLLTMMGGSIEVKSVYGQGSEFIVTIPQAVVSDEALGDFKSKFEKHMLERKAYEESFRAPDAQILVVDDTSLNLTVVKGLLKDTEICIETACNGMKSVEMAGRKKYDLILMDQRMPGMDGTQAMHRILADPASPNLDTPFICLTADAVTGARERYMAEGFTDYLTKPIDAEELEAMMVRYLPEEKVLPGKVKKTEKEHSDDFKVLMDAGINVSEGLMHCQNDETFYGSILKEYVDGSMQKRSDIQSFYEEMNWKEYSVVVHSVKSSSKMIGASDLSAIAAELEKASDDGNDSVINEKHSDMMEMYETVTGAVCAYLGISGDQGRGDSDAKSDDILEFLPD